MEELRRKLEAVIDLHEKMKGVYFWHAESSAGGRRSCEKKNSLTTDFEWNGDKYRIEQITECTCSHTEFHTNYYINGEWVRADIRLVKKILKQIA